MDGCRGRTETAEVHGEEEMQAASNEALELKALSRGGGGYQEGV